MVDLKLKGSNPSPKKDKLVIRRNLITLALFLLAISLGLNFYLLYRVDYYEVKINKIYLSNESLLRIGDELYQMRERLRMPSKVMEKLLPEIIYFESKDNYLATGDNGRSHGAGQIQMPTAKGTMDSRYLTIEDLYNPYVNPFLASEHLEVLFSKYRDVRKTLSAYNGGLRKDTTGSLYISNPIYVDTIQKGIKR